jgi:hypothetical protein
MTGGQASLFVEPDAADKKISDEKPAVSLVNNSPVIKANNEELSSHQALVDFIIEKSDNNNW